MRPKERWEIVRVKGSLYFTFIRGVLLAGCLFILPGCLSKQLADNQPVFSVGTLLAFIGSLASGYLLAGIIWTVNEARYSICSP